MGSKILKALGYFFDWPTIIGIVFISIATTFMCYYPDSMIPSAWYFWFNLISIIATAKITSFIISFKNGDYGK